MLWTQKPIFKFLNRAWLSLLLIPFLSCSLSGPSTTTAPISTTCVIPADQTGTITGHWTTLPIPIALHQGDFDPTAEAPKISAAADTWNNFLTASKKLQLYDYGGTASSPRLSAAVTNTGTANFCSQTILQGTQYNGDLMIYKLGTWPYPANVIALTRFCTIQATPYPKFYMAVMELNYQNYFVAGQKLPDFQSIVTHELGHGGGLGHSCATPAVSGFPDCSSPTLPADYLNAIMYPTFTFDSTGAGQVKTSLDTNDEERANCLYGT